MTRINSILQSNLFSHGRFRGVYVEIFERCFSEKIGSDISFVDIPYSVFQSNFEIEKVLSNAFTYFKNQLIFDHSPTDYELKKLFFIFLIYSVEKYPDRESWTNFLTETSEDSKIQVITEGVTLIWARVQNYTISDWFQNQSPHIEVSSSNINSDDLPF
jgi:hypothetical protein